MPFKYIKNKSPDFLTFEAIFKHTINSEQMGLVLWDITEDSLTIYDKICNFSDKTIHSFEDYINEIVYKKDLGLALIDLKEFLKNPDIPYKSHFRVKGVDNEIKWVLFKGQMIELPHNQHQALLIVIYDVSGTNFEAGNDSTTDLLGRNFFLDKVESTIQSCFPDQKHALISLHFQNMPDFYDYDLRSAILREIARVFTSFISEDHEVAKFPGERFAFLIRNYKDEKQLEEITGKIAEFFKSPLKVQSRNVLLDIRIGIATYPNDSTESIELMMYAELATNQSILSDSNRITFFDIEFADKFHRNLIIENELLKAIHRKEFYLTYQLQKDSVTDQVIGIEALLRWENRYLGSVYPDEFIPVAERMGQIIDIGYWVIEEAISTAKAWKDEGYVFDNISINISPVELMDKMFIEKLLNICDQYEYAYDAVELEITEGIDINAVKNSLSVIKKLINFGFSIAVDDFGTGYSNLNFLIQANMTTLKLDRSIIHHLDNHSNQLLVKGIINLCRELDYYVLAEGVETLKQVEQLKALGCTRLQGFYFNRPLRKEAIEKLLTKNLDSSI